MRKPLVLGTWSPGHAFVGLKMRVPNTQIDPCVLCHSIRWLHCMDVIAKNTDSFHRNRAYNEKNKGHRANHNRKEAASRKLAKGML